MTRIGQRLARAAFVAVTLSSVATGCGGEQWAEQVGEQVIDGDVEVDEDSLSITDDEGNEFSAGTGTELPASWPSDVPVFPGGELVLATTQSDGTATALWEITSSVDDAAQRYDDALTSQGFVLEQEADVGGTIVRTYAGTLHTVNLTVARVTGSTNLNVSAVPR